jgi:DNA-binding CsgD family transcriptional regulator
MPQSIAAQTLFEFTMSCAGVTTPEELSSLLLNTVRKLGFDHVNVSIMRDHALPRRAHVFGFTNTYPEEWQNYYAQRDCIRFDPVAQFARGDARPFFWKDLAIFLNLTSLQTNFLGLSEDAGLNNGIGIPFFGSSSLHGGIALATASPQTEHLRDLGVLSSIADAFYRRLRALYSIAAGPETSRQRHRIILTEREIEILNLSVGGHSDRAIANLLEISENTVNTHFRRMFRKLGANSRVQAAITAVKLGFLD